MTATAWLGLIAVVAVFVAMPVAYWWLERDARMKKPPTFKSGVDYRRF